jgi:hypothetical protein
MVTVKSDTIWQKIMVSVVTAAIISAGASGVASYVEIKLLRNDLTNTVRLTEKTANKVDSLETRVTELEVKCGKR